MRSFDKALRKKERLYRKKNAEKIESLNNVNHNNFWSEINKLGPQKTGQIPNKVYVENSVVSDTDVVLTKWKNDFQQLYNPPKDDSEKYDNEFYNFIKGQVNELLLNSDGVDENVYLNDVINFDEIKKKYCKTKIREGVRIR